MSVSRFMAVAFSSSVVVLAACHGESRPATTTTTTGGATGATANENAIHGMAMARCDREEICDNVGSGKKFATREVCMAELRDKGREELRATECPGGIDQAQLDKCLADIRGERCGNPLDTVTRLASCRTSALCLK